MAYQREKPETLETKNFVIRVKTVIKPLLIFTAFGVFPGLAFGAFGVVLALYGSDHAASSIRLLGQTINTTSVGLGCIAIGAIVIVWTIRSALTVFREWLRHLGHK